MFEMNEKQKALFDKLTQLQRRMALNSIAGMKPAENHKDAGGVCKNEPDRRKLASEILTNPDVEAFLDSMKAVAVSNAVMSRQEMLERLSNLARVSMVDLVEFDSQVVDGGDEGPITQSQWRIKDSAMQSKETMAAISEVSTGKEGLKIKQHSPLSAMKMISDMEGYNAPIKTEQSGVVATVEMSKEDYAEIRKKMLEQDDC